MAERAQTGTETKEISVLRELTPSLLDWYRANARELPWRQDPSPYHVWISEIMLQQTRVEAVKPYYRRFLEALPTIEDLADCPEDRLLKLWEGLGYYSRARNLQKTARRITREDFEIYAGELPADVEALRKLPGIGPYTAGAIASIAYRIPVPAVDGNVLRVISRILEREEDIGSDAVKRGIDALLTRVIPKDAPGDFNQALMELGATVCLPNGAPLCEDCPVRDRCLARLHKTADRIPVKAPKKARRIEKKTVLVIRDGILTLLRRRPAKGLLAGLYEFPCFDGRLSEQEALEQTKRMGLSPLQIHPLQSAKHIFTHVEWHMKGYLILVEELGEQRGEDTLAVTPAQAMRDYSIPSAYAAYAAALSMEVGAGRREK